jgi:large repetitive protein
VPSNTGIALPGLYMLFAMNADGVPSVSRLVRVGGTGTPQLAWPGEQSHALGAAVNLALSAPGASSFSASGLPPGLSINSATGVITGTVAAEGSYNVTVSASNANGTVSTALLWRVVVVGSTRFVKLEALSEINGNPWSSMAELNLLDESGATVSRSGWVVTADSFEVGEGPARIIDGNPETQWHTQWQSAAPTHPHWVVVDMGTQRRLGGFRYLPYGSDGTGRIALFNFYVSADGINWGSPVVSGDFRTMGAPEAEKTVLFAVAQPNRPPVVSTPSAQSSTQGQAAALTVAASDPDGDTLAYGATGLPPGLVIGGSSGVISGTPTTAGNYSVTVSVQDGRGGSASASFAWAVLAPPPTVISPVTAPPAATGSSVTYNASATGSGLQYAWDFGDGTSAPFSTSASVTHVYANAGLYTVTLSVRTTDGSVTTSSFVQAVVRPATTLRPAASSNIVFEARAGANARVWLVNPDNDSVSVFDAVTNAKLAEVTVGTGPRTLAVGGGSVWVANRYSATLSLISTSTLAVTQTITLPRASMPYGIAWSATDNAAWLTLEATGQLLRLDASGAVTGSVAVGPNPRQVSISADGTRVFVSRFITPPLPGEGTASVQTSIGGVPRGAEVVVVDGGTRAVLGSTVLAHSEKPDNTIQGRAAPR